MAAKKEEVKAYKVTVKDNSSCTEIGAGGAAFANGIATITDKWLAEWFKCHEGYIVEEVKEPVEEQ